MIDKKEKEREIVSYLKGFIGKSDVLLPNIINNYILDTNKKIISFNLCENRKIEFIDIAFPKRGTRILLCKSKEQICVNYYFLEWVVYDYSTYDEKSIEKILLKLIQVNN